MADRTVSVKLRAEIDQYRKDMQSAAQATEGVASAAGEAGKASKDMGRLGEAARSFGRTAAVAATAGVTAMAAITVGTFKAGAAYNTLEQTSRAALTTLLGSAEAANEQMDILREFGRTSPFPRQIWIEAQQTLIAFGMAAEDVVPTLSAIQDAAAAAGLSSHQIGEIVDVFAKIQSSGRITGRELQQFAIRGIDAAQLLGDAYGKSADQIRNDITSGAIDGREALTLLAEQMSIKFEGAAENVKNTWFGAVDRIKGATRDIGSIIAAPFIDPMGGGAAVQWANDVADALRAFESQLEPVVALLAHRAEPAFQAISDRLQTFAEAIKNADLDRLVRDLSGMAPALAGVGVGVATLGSQSALAAVGLSRMAGAINPLAAGLTAMVVASPELRSVLVDLLNAFTPLLPPVVDLAEVMARSLTPILQVLAEVMRPVVGMVELLTGAFSLLPGPLQTALLALGALKLLNLGPAIAGAVASLKALATQTTLTAASIGASPTLGLRGAATGFLRFLGGPWTLAIAGAVGAISLFASSQRDSREAVRELTESLDPQTGAFTDASVKMIAAAVDSDRLREALGHVGLTMGDLMNAAINGGAALEFYERRMNTLLGEGGKNISMHRALRDGVGEAKDMADEAQDEWEFLAEALGIARGASDELTPAQKRLQDQFGLTAGEAKNVTEAVEDQIDALRRATDPVFALFKALEDVEKAQADYTEAVREYGRQSPQAEKASFDLAKAVIGVDVAANDADLSFGDFRKQIREWEKDGKITKQQADILRGSVEDLEGAAKSYERGGPYSADIDANTNPAVNKLTSFVREWNGKEIHINVRPQVAGMSLSQIEAFKAPGRAMGGPIFGPGGPTSDSIPAWLSNGEHVWTAREVAAAGGHGAVEQLRQSVLRDSAPRFAQGGGVSLKALASGLQDVQSVAMGAARMLASTAASPLAWAASQRGKPYIWGGVGPRGYDCSGYMSAIVNVIKGRNPYSRLGATATFPWGGFTRGQGRFMIGSVKNAGNGIGHMSGTLNGVNVEARGGNGVVVGPGARGANDSLYRGNVWRLQGYKDGGPVHGDPPFDLIDPKGLFVRGSFERGTSRVPMDGLYRLHRDEAVVPADLNKQLTMALQSGLKGSGSTTQINVNAEPEARKIADAVVRRLEQRDLMYGRN